ncbi:hypothetical protein PVAND_015062 [Polypedilum vanderplanki]|uniref:Fatty acid desaturase domain-containing protein n=1 Tax=Polypedilum vanderplanki TaxID=319348 RepID=A0A9J6BBU6_POLVA|nr:hypothetical protein PVAND_015062 [Polypedilum vanderplanki]
MQSQLNLKETKIINSSEQDNLSTSKGPFRTEIVWRNVLIFVLLHIFALLGLFHFDRRMFYFSFVYGWFGSYGISAGAHRLWCHRSYKANRKLEYILLFLNTIAVQNSVIEWVRDHRVHHKFSDTDADPHNSQRGFFFSHMGWLLCKKHPDVKKFGAKIDMSDLTSDWLLRFQHKYYVPLAILISFALPIFVSMKFFSTSFKTAFFMTSFRYLLTLHITWMINSVSHIGNWKPYDKNIEPSDSKLFGTLTFGEGWHNFHHVFPWDYKVSELPLYRYNVTIPFIDFFAWLGWATDLKVASEDMIRKRVLRTGDGSHPYSIEAAKNKQIFNEINNNLENDVKRGNEVYWGLNDEDIPEEDRQEIEIWCKKHD